MYSDWPYAVILLVIVAAAIIRASAGKGRNVRRYDVTVQGAVCPRCLSQHA